MPTMITKIFEHLDKNFKIIRVMPAKPTARCPFSAIVDVSGHKKYVVIAQTDIQKFYLKRAIDKQREFYKEFSSWFKFNFPDSYGDLENFSYAIYPYIEKAHWCHDERPIKIIKEIYKKYSKTYKTTPEILEKLQIDFLSSWPERFHKDIKKLPLYKEYFDIIAKQQKVKVYREHCDYTVNNILDDGKNLWLIDFEFAKNFQVTGHDTHDYQRTLNPEKYKSKLIIYKIKEKLMDDINNILDKEYNNNKKSKKKRESIMKKIKRLFYKKHKKFSYPKIWDIKPFDKICVLAPHPDDETIGCGGLLTLYAKQCDVICLTDGCYGDPDIEPVKMTQIRKKEFENVMRKIGVNKFETLGIEDSKLENNFKQFQKIDLHDYNYIVIPSPNDSHPDHMAVNQILKKSMYGKAQIVYYEIWNTLAKQTHYIDISKVVNKKRNLINMYKSQVKHIDYADRILSLNHYRGICHNIEYEEAYEFKD